MVKNSIDRLSNLPDSILNHIFSFLDTKSVVQTSVLSKLWKCTWKHVSLLRFDSCSFRSYSNFERYVNKVLSLRSSVNLREVTLIDREDSNLRQGSLFVKVIEYAFSHGTQHLTIDLYNKHSWDEADYSFSYLFGSTVSHHSNLKSLELDVLFLDVGFRSSGFRMLKKLKLATAVFTSEDEQVFDFFSEFPCLEDLTLDGVHCNDRNSDNVKILKIFGLRLRTLNIWYNQFVMVAINTPNLESFTFHNFNTFVGFPELAVYSLEHADIWIDNYSCPPEMYIDYADYFITFFAALSNVTSLALCQSTLEKEASPFKRLETLNLEPYDNADIPCRVIDYFARGFNMNITVKYV